MNKASEFVRQNIFHQDSECNKFKWPKVNFKLYNTNKEIVLLLKSQRYPAKIPHFYLVLYAIMVLSIIGASIPVGSDDTAT